MDAKRNIVVPLVSTVSAVVVVAAVAVGVTVSRQNQTPKADNSGGLVLDYADGVTVVDDESALQAAVDKMLEDAENEMVASFQPQAVSEDGKTFSCYIANSEYNEYDMFIALYTNLEEDPIFLSGLMRPGDAFREITLDDALDKGAHEVNLVFTQVEDDHSTIHGQSIVSIDMQVN